MTTTAAIEADLTDALVRIRRAWKRPDAEQERSGGKRPHGPRIPIDLAWFDRTSVAQDIAFWVQAANEAGTARVADDERIDLGNVDQCAGHLLRHAKALSGWEHAERMAWELERAARSIEALTRAPKPRVPLGACPVEIVATDGTREPCGGEVRADVDKASDVKCPRCGTVDTIEWWQRRILGEVGPVTADGLAVVLRRVGIRTSAAGIRQRVHRGSILPTSARDEQGRMLFDPVQVLAGLAAREARRLADTG